MNLKKLLTAFCINLVMAGTALAGATPDQAKALVDKAIDHVKAVGTERAYKDFNAAGPFIDGELYIFAYDMQGNNLALGGNPKMTGKNLIDMKSADGRPVIKDFIELIKATGEGWYDYKWINPETKKLQDKTSYIKKIPGTDAFVGCGIYK